MILFVVDFSALDSIIYMKFPPKYDLNEIKKLLTNSETRIIRRRDRREAASLGYADDEEMVERVNRLHPNEFDKTMMSEEKSGLWMDAYKTSEPNGIMLYIKLQTDANCGVIVSFKKA